MRIVNGRLLRSESFDQLVDPRRTLNPESARIHGITPAMLAGKPVVDDVLPAFHAWCEDTVLVAHNAAFDMRFLQMKEARTGVRFTQPVLDTLLLSAVVHPNQESHRLEAIAERLGIPIVGRHNALGDAIVTGEVLLKLIPLLAEQGYVPCATPRGIREELLRAHHLLMPGPPGGTENMFGEMFEAMELDAAPSLHSQLGSIVRRAPVTVNLGQSIRAGLQAMDGQRVGSVIVIDPDTERPRGIFTLQDLLRRVALKNVSLDDPIDGVMTRNLVTLRPSDRL